MAGFISEWWPESNRNGGRHQIGIPGRIASEFAVIPPKRNRTFKRPYDAELYKERNIIERFFNKLKQFRRVATRYDKLLANFMGFVKLAAIAIWLK